ncbi:MAG: hypothetical protein E8A46_02600, partial [Bradyrhizobium sp.]|uniref:hypothetical protein n=1 Tax=Bradyrhizobium sp. TaxID=376 RepID=UPI001221F30F
MRKFLTFLIALAAIVFAVVSPASADSCSRAFGYQGGTGCNSVIAGGGGYTGPGDIITFTNWYGLRAYNGAYATATGNIADIVDTATGAASCTIVAKTTGDADLSTAYCTGSVSVTTFCTVTHAAGCSVKKLYDQVGTNHLTQATLTSMPLLVLSGVTGLG